MNIDHVHTEKLINQAANTILYMAIFLLLIQKFFIDTLVGKNFK